MSETAVRALAPLPATGAATTLRVRLEGVCPWAERVRRVVLPAWRELRALSDGPAPLRLAPAGAAGDPVEVWLHGSEAGLRAGEASLRALAREAGVEVDAARGLADALIPADWPAAGDPAAVGAAGAAAAAATEVCLDGLASGRGELPAYAERQRALLALIVAAVPDPAARAPYLAYHRDALVRHPLVQSGHGSAKVDEVFGVLGAQVRRLGAPAFADVARSVAGTVHEGALARWSRAVRALARAGASPAADDDRVDPFAAEPWFPLVFRALHSAARLLGIAPLDEAFLHHLLLGDAGQGSGRARFCLTPHAHLLPEPELDETGRVPGSFEEGYPWRELVQVSGAAGAAWLERYRASEARVGRSIQAALPLLRKGRLDEGLEHLRLVEAHRGEVRAEQPGVYHVLGRFYHGELAYYHYVTGDLPRAEREMDAAAASVRRAIETHRFLLPIAPLVVDIPLQKARIARRRRDWAGMEAQLDAMYRMETGAVPLLVLADGTGVDYAALGRHFAGMDLGDHQRRPANRMLDVGCRLLELRRLTLRLYALPDLVVPTCAW
jgi:hypothetical protein